MKKRRAVASLLQTSKSSQWKWSAGKQSAGAGHSCLVIGTRIWKRLYLPETVCQRIFDYFNCQYNVYFFLGFSVTYSVNLRTDELICLLEFINLNSNDTWIIVGFVSLMTRIMVTIGGIDTMQNMDVGFTDSLALLPFFSI